MAWCGCGTVDQDDAPEVQGDRSAPAADMSPKSAKIANDQVRAMRAQLRSAGQMAGWEAPGGTVESRPVPERPDHVRLRAERAGKNLPEGYAAELDDDETSARTRATQSLYPVGTMRVRPEDNEACADEMEFLAEVLGDTAIDQEVHGKLAAHMGLTQEEIEKQRNNQLVGVMENRAEEERHAQRREDAACDGFEDAATPRAQRKGSPRPSTTTA